MTALEISPLLLFLDSSLFLSVVKVVLDVYYFIVKVLILWLQFISASLNWGLHLV